MSEARAALAFVARRQGRSSMPLSSWGHVLSLELAWLKPAEARAYIEACRDAGLLIPDGDAYRPSFDVAQVEVPRRFRLHPGAERPKATGGDPFTAWVDRVAAAKGIDAKAVLQQVAAKQEAHGGLMEAEAALLLLAAEAGVDVRAAAKDALARLKASS